MTRKSQGIREVAAEAGVSVTTVSHALSGHGVVSGETRQRVQAAADRLGYAPNRIARALRSSRSNVLAFVGEELATSPSAGPVLAGAQAAAAELGFMIMIVNAQHGVIDGPQVEALLAQQVDATIFVAASHRAIDLPGRLDTGRTVLVGAWDPARGIPAIVPDEVAIGRLATEHLLRAGHRDIVHLTVDDGMPASVGRAEGFCAAMGDAGRHPRVFRVPGPADARAGAAAMRAARAADTAPDAVFAFDDVMAMGVYQEAGALVQSRLSVVGAGDLRPVAESLRPALTSVALPWAEMGRRAVAIAVGMPVPDAVGESIARLPGVLVERASVRSRAATT
jgi:LacI family transcriptional regulator